MGLYDATRELIDLSAARARAGNPQMFNAFVGEVYKYDPAKNAVYVKYYHSGDDPTITQQHQVKVPWGGPGYGVQGGLEEGTQVLLFQLDPAGDDLVCLGVLYNEVDTAPGTPASEFWVTDKRGSYTKLTQDGATPGDGQGAVKTQGAAYAQHSTASGSALTLDDSAKTAQVASAGGHQLNFNDLLQQALLKSSGGTYTLFDDVGRVASTVTAGGHSIVMQDAVGDVLGSIVTRTAAGLQHLLNDETGEVSTIASKIGLGNVFAELPASAAGIAKTHITELGSTIDNNRLSDLLTLAQAMVTAGIPSAAGLVTIVEGWLISVLGATAIPAGSGTVRLAT
jgi:hypothetical protein